MSTKNTKLKIIAAGHKAVEELIKVAEDPILNPNSEGDDLACLLYTSPSPRDRQKSRMPSSA